jgi:hypothetical protein
MKSPKPTFWRSGVDLTRKSLLGLVLVHILVAGSSGCPSSIRQSVNSGGNTDTAVRASQAENRLNGQSHIEFTVGNAGEIQTKEGIHLGFTDYWAADGISLRVLYNDDGAAAFSKEVGNATRIVKRGPKLDSKGKIVGERALVELPPANRGWPTRFAVMWTDGFRFHEIRSSSLQHILELEKIYKY